MTKSALAAEIAEPDYLHAPTKFKGLFGWIFSTDHKRIAILYLATMMLFFLVAVILGVLMRVELFSSGRTIVDPQTYNQMFTLHGVIMIFLFIIPGMPAVFGNFMLPLMIGAKDVFFPRLNLFSWWLFLAGALTVVVSLFLPGGPSDTGWTFYVPYSIRTTTNVIPALAGAFILGFSSILTGLNFITTIHRMRAPGMSWFKMPLFIWAIYSTAWVQILATPVIGITLLLVTIERLFGIGIFDPAMGGDPVLYQHLFWMYSHPAVYIMILPALGVVSEIIPVFARRTIFGYKFIAYSSIAIASVGSLVWAHHMFTVGMSNTGMFVFSLLTFLLDCNALQRIDSDRCAAAVCPFHDRSVLHRRVYGTNARRIGGQYSCDRYVFCRGAFPLRHVRRSRFCAFCGDALLVSQNVRKNDPAKTGDDRMAADDCGIQHVLFYDVHSRLSGYAAQVLRFSAGVPAAPPDRVGGIVDSGGRDFSGCCKSFHFNPARGKSADESLGRKNVRVDGSVAAAGGKFS
jgi:hypothetical protein